MTLVPVKFSEANGTVKQFYFSDSFDLSPFPATMFAPQSLKVSNRKPSGNHFDAFKRRKVLPKVNHRSPGQLYQYFSRALKNSGKVA